MRNFRQSETLLETGVRQKRTLIHLRGHDERSQRSSKRRTTTLDDSDQGIGSSSDQVQKRLGSSTRGTSRTLLMNLGSHSMAANGNLHRIWPSSLQKLWISYRLILRKSQHTFQIHFLSLKNYPSPPPPGRQNASSIRLMLIFKVGAALR